MGTGSAAHAGSVGMDAMPCRAKLHLGSSAASLLYHHHCLGHLPARARGPRCPRTHPVGHREPGLPLAKPQGTAGDCLNPIAPRGPGRSTRARERPGRRAGKGRALQAAARCRPRARDTAKAVRGSSQRDKVGHAARPGSCVCQLRASCPRPEGLPRLCPHHSAPGLSACSALPCSTRGFA